MLPHQERVVVEKKELDEKLQKLEAFVDGEVCRKLPESEQGLLRQQQNAMEIYSSILGKRIAGFPQ